MPVLAGKHSDPIRILHIIAGTLGAAGHKIGSILTGIHMNRIQILVVFFKVHTISFLSAGSCSPKAFSSSPGKRKSPASLPAHTPLLYLRPEKKTIRIFYIFHTFSPANLSPGQEAFPPLQIREGFSPIRRKGPPLSNAKEGAKPPPYSPLLSGESVFICPRP
jgi:hypothetical protein